jgi:ankyrin repeat protein
MPLSESESENEEESLLLRAIQEKRSLNDIKTYINSSDINRANAYLLTPLHFAAMSERQDVKELLMCLIESGANLEAVSRTGDTPLSLAIQTQPLDVIKPLIASSIINHPNRGGLTPLHLTVANPVFEYQLLVKINGGGYANALGRSYRPDGKELVECLMQNGADPNACTSKKETPLLLAIKYRRSLEVINLLVTSQVVNDTDVDGLTPIYWAMQGGIAQRSYASTTFCEELSKIITALLTPESDLKIADSYGMTPLRMAVISGDLSVIRQLIVHTLLQDPNTQKPKYFSTDSDLSAIWDTASKEIKEMIDKKISWGTCLFYTFLKMDNTKLMQIISKNNFDNCTPYLDKYPILLAVLQDKLELLKSLIEERYVKDRHEQLTIMKSELSCFNGLEFEMEIEQPDCADSRNNTTKNLKVSLPSPCVETIYKYLNLSALKNFHAAFFPNETTAVASSVPPSVPISPSKHLKN